MIITLEGKINERAKNSQMPYHEIYIEGKKIEITGSLKVRDHAVEFSWGFGGAGPAQAALAICMEIFEDFSSRKDYTSIYQTFKWNFLAQRTLEKDFELKIDLKKFTRQYDDLRIKRMWKSKM